MTVAERTLKEEAYKVKADNAKDYTNLIVNNGMNAVRTKMVSLTAENEKDINKKIEYLFEGVVNDWQKSLTAMNNFVFSGEESGIEILTKLIHRGNSNNRTIANSLEIQEEATKFLVSVMVPEVWRLQGYHPVLLDTTFPCDVSGIGVRQWTDKKNVGEALICRKKEGGIGRDDRPFSGGRQYQLWGVKDEWGASCQSRNCRIGDCNHFMESLPGLKKIREEIKEWNGLSIFDMLDKWVSPRLFCMRFLLTNGGSAKDGIDNIWHGNHKYTVDDATNPNLIEQVVSGLENSMHLFKLPGTVSIPSCSWAEIQSNWAKGITNDNKGTYPCSGN